MLPHTNLTVLRRLAFAMQEIFDLYIQYSSLRYDDSSVYIYIPNNNKKRFFIVKGSESREVSINDNAKDVDALVEGYVYDSDKFLATDLIYTLENGLETGDYMSKYSKLQSLGLELHPIVESETLIPFFYNGFKYSKELVCIEKVCIQNSFIKSVIKTHTDTQYKVLTVTKGNLPDIYLTQEGLLYVKGIKESLYLQNLFSRKRCIDLECIFNNQFCKWSPVIN